MKNSKGDYPKIIYNLSIYIYKLSEASSRNRVPSICHVHGIMVMSRLNST